MHKAPRRVTLPRFLAALVAGIALVTLGATAGPAVAAALGQDSVGSWHIKDQGVKERDTSAWIQRQFDRANTVPTKFRTSGDPVTVEHVGGSWGTLAEPRATKLHEFTLNQPGRYVVNADGFFMTTAADGGRDVRMQLALRYEDGSDWGVDAGTAFTDTLSPAANREATTHTTRVVKVDEPTTIQVFAFGYEDDQGSGASGQVTAQSYVTAQRIG